MEPIRKILGNAGLARAVLLLFVHQAAALAQIPDRRGMASRRDDASAGRFLVQAWPAPEPGSLQTRLFVFVQIERGLLRFVRNDTAFLARFDLTLELRDPSGTAAAVQTRGGSASASGFPGTRAAGLPVRERFVFSLPGGTYRLRAELYDRDSRQSHVREETVSLPGSRDPEPRIGAPLFFRGPVSPFALDDPPFPLLPPVRAATDTGFAAFAAVWWPRADAELTVRTLVVSGGTVDASPDSFLLKMRGTALGLRIPVGATLSAGVHTLAVRLSDGAARAEMSETFQVLPGGGPDREPDRTPLFEPLAYVMDRAEHSALKALPDADRVRGIAEFWKKRDPTPDTETNELEEEFLRRVEFANRSFSLFQGGLDGWRLDRGRVYILYGPPEQIERPDFTGMPGTVEVWYFPSLSRRFVFFDRTGTGRFELARQEFD